MKMLLLLGALLTIANFQQISPTPPLEVISAENIDRLVELSAYSIPDERIVDIEFSPDGASLWLVATDGIVRIWNIETGNLTDLTNEIRLSEASLDIYNMQMACFCENSSPISAAKVFDLETGSILIEVNDIGHSEIVLSADGAHLATAGGGTRLDQFVQVWDIEHGRQLLSVERTDWLSSIEFSPQDHNVIAVGDYFGAIQIWKIDQSSLENTLQQWFRISELGGVSRPIGDIAFSTDGRLLASMSPEGLVWLWDARTGDEIARLQSEYSPYDPAQVNCVRLDCKVVFNPTGDSLFTANGMWLQIWDVQHRNLLRTIQTEATNLAFDSLGTLLAMGDDEGTVSIWTIAESS